MMIIDEPKETKTQRNNKKKLEKLQDEAYDKGHPIPEVIPPTKRKYQQDAKKRKLRARSNLSQFRTPDEIKVQKAKIPAEMLEIMEETIKRTNRTLANKRRNARKPVKASALVSGRFSTVKRVNQFNNELPLRQAARKAGGN